MVLVYRGKSTKEIVDLTVWACLFMYYVYPTKLLPVYHLSPAFLKTQAWLFHILICISNVEKRTKLWALFKKANLVKTEFVNPDIRELPFFVCEASLKVWSHILVTHSEPKQNPKLLSLYPLKKSDKTFKDHSFLMKLLIWCMPHELILSLE